MFVFIFIHHEGDILYWNPYKLYAPFPVKFFQHRWDSFRLRLYLVLLQWLRSVTDTALQQLLHYLFSMTLHMEINKFGLVILFFNILLSKTTFNNDTIFVCNRVGKSFALKHIDGCQYWIKKNTECRKVLIA